MLKKSFVYRQCNFFHGDLLCFRLAGDTPEQETEAGCCSGEAYLPQSGMGWRLESGRHHDSDTSGADLNTSVSPSCKRQHVDGASSRHKQPTRTTCFFWIASLSMLWYLLIDAPKIAI